MRRSHQPPVKRCFDIDEPTTIPLPRTSSEQQCAPGYGKRVDVRRLANVSARGYWWNSTTQELIEILPEDHPESPTKSRTHPSSDKTLERRDIMTEPQSVVTESAPMTGSERVRRARERKRDDVIFIGIEILPKERDAPIRTGLLAKADRNNKKAVRDALCAYFEKHLDPEARP